MKNKKALYKTGEFGLNILKVWHYYWALCVDLPLVHKQVPLEHIPWAEHLGSQVLTVQTSPCHPGSQTHRPDSQDPWGPQSKLQRSGKTWNGIKD